MPRKYGPKASKTVERAMHKMKRGKLKSGKSQRKVKNPKQAIAIGLSEARQKGAKVPPKTSSRKGSTGAKSSRKSSSTTRKRSSSAKPRTKSSRSRTRTNSR